MPRMNDSVCGHCTNPIKYQRFIASYYLFSVHIFLNRGTIELAFMQKNNIPAT